MKIIEKQISDTNILLYENPDADYCLIQLLTYFDKDSVSTMLDKINLMSNGSSFSYVGIIIENSNYALSPWDAPAVFKDGSDFGNGALKTLTHITECLLPEIKNVFNHKSDNVKYILGGYSLAGLFALWAGYNTKVFYGIAAASPSVWFPKWNDFISENTMYAEKVYLSLGKKEAKTSNPIMRQVSDCIKLQYDTLSTQIGADNCFFQQNPGNHFCDAPLRMAKGFSWCISGNTSIS